MTFTDEQKQAEFDALAALCQFVAKRPYTAKKRGAINQLQSFAAGQYGGDAQRAIISIFAAKNEQPKNEQPKSGQPQERTLGKQTGGAARRNTPPATKQQPAPGSERYKRQLERGVLPESKSEVPEVVVGVDEKRKLPKAVVAGERSAFAFKEPPPDKSTVPVRAKEVAGVGLKADEIPVVITTMPPKFGMVHLSTDATFDTGRTENDLFADAKTMTWKELLERHDDSLIHERLLTMGETYETLDGKTPRQLANLLKRKVSE